MAARSRPRNGTFKEDLSDAHEEKSMWEQIQRDLYKCSQLQTKQRENASKIQELEANMRNAPSVDQIDELQKIYRENVRLSSEEYKFLRQEPADIIKNLNILRALRAASESEPARPPPTPLTKVRGKQAKANGGGGGSGGIGFTSSKFDALDGAIDSPIASPALSVGGMLAARLKGAAGRSGSVASVRETRDKADARERDRERDREVKAEDGEGGRGVTAERAGKFFRGAEVAYKQAKMKEDGSQWIQCLIVNLTESGNKKRYEVQDPEPDETGAPGQIYKTTAAALIAIPTPDAVLVDYSVGKTVLARYPETTTFYRAEVTGKNGGMCRLKFEDDQNQEMEVERRYVLDMSNK